MGVRSVYDWAEEYLEAGYQVIPIQAGGKKPTVQWQKYQQEKVTSDLLKSWFLERADANIAIVCGAITSLVVIDFDPRHSDPDDPGPALSYSGEPVLTGGGGVHWYCRSVGNVLGNYTGVYPGCDIRGEGGYVVSPPSKTTGTYKFMSDMVPEIASLPEVGSTGIVEYLEQKKLKTKKGAYQQQDIRNNTQAGSFMRLRFMPAQEGNRNHQAARTAGSICRAGNSYQTGLHILRYWNATHCTPSLDDGELQLVWQSIFSKHNRIKPTGESIGNDTRADQATGQPPPK